MDAGGHHGLPVEAKGTDAVEDDAGLGGEGTERGGIGGVGEENWNGRRWVRVGGPD